MVFYLHESFPITVPAVTIGKSLCLANRVSGFIESCGLKLRREECNQTTHLQIPGGMNSTVVQKTYHSLSFTPLNHKAVSCLNSLQPKTTEEWIKRNHKTKFKWQDNCAFEMVYYEQRILNHRWEALESCASVSFQLKVIKCSVYILNFNLNWNQKLVFIFTSFFNEITE